ncbi:hypothetical protein [Ensifer sp. ENS03]|uniref:hypothetical protein n=1 Tax=Ensifer sp. ENS03 TaxID=2769283 RepID=UPI00178303AF|nr:hypothetical protein [Ensifer sp. ENS03]MBD9561094.1 hypothetical protein [Ensifer sp. ENS03]
MKQKFLVIGFLALLSIDAQAASPDDLRLHYYFLRGSLVGQSPFAKSVNEFRSHFDRLRADPINTNVSIMQRTHELIELHPTTAGSGASAQILDDLRTISEKNYKDSKKVFKALSLYSMFTRYLTSGPMRAPRAYEALGLQSEQELEKFRDNMIYLTTMSNAGALTQDEQQALDLFFRYYIGVPSRLGVTEIMADPLMLPVKDSAAIEGRLKEQLGGDLSNLRKASRVTQDLVATLRSQIKDEGLRQALRDASAELHQATSFAEIDEILKRLNGIACEGDQAPACDEGKRQSIKLAEKKKEQIARSEFEYGIEQSIELGIAVGRLTKSDDLTKSFQALKAVNDAYQAVSKGMAAFGSASTTMGQVGAVAGAASGVVGAVVAVSAIIDGGGKTADEAILESLQELKEMIVKLSEQIEAGFSDVATRTDRIEALLKSYSNLSSKNDFTLQQELVALRAEVREGLQPLKLVRLSYAEKAYDQYKSLGRIGTDFLLSLPREPTSPLPAMTKRLLTSLFAELFIITAAIQKGEYNIAISEGEAAEAHFSVINELAAYPPSLFRTAFLAQNAVNASQVSNCSEVNLIGLLMVSEAAGQVNGVLDNVSHFQLSDYLSDSTVNQEQFKHQLRAGAKFVAGQRTAVAKCVSKALYQDFEATQIRRLIGLLEGQLDTFFEDGSRLNDMLVTLVANYPLPGGFHRESFFAGQLIREARSFDPEAWERVAPMPSVLPIHGLGTQGFQMTRSDFTGFVPTYQIRLGPSLGADFQFFIENWWSPGKYLLPLQIALTSPRNKKLIHMWRGQIDREWLTDPSLYSDTFRGSNAIYFRLIPDSLPRVYAMLNDRGIGLLGTMDARQGQRGNAFKWVPGRETVYCNMLDGFYECNGAAKQNYKTYNQFEPGNFFLGPVLAPHNGDMLSLPPARHVSLDWFSSFHNKYRKEFSEGMIAYVSFLRDTATETLSPCLQRLVQGVSFTCDVTGFRNVFPDRSDEYRHIEEFNLTRMTLDPTSKETQRTMELTDLARISSIKVEPHADEAISQIQAFLGTLKERLAALQREPRAEVELSSDVDQLIANEYDWLDRRLRPFVVNQAN